MKTPMKRLERWWDICCGKEYEHRMIEREIYDIIFTLIYNSGPVDLTSFNILFRIILGMLSEFLKLPVTV